jgi:hypothetical protein
MLCTPVTLWFDTASHTGFLPQAGPGLAKAVPCQLRAGPGLAKAVPCQLHAVPCRAKASRAEIVPCRAVPCCAVSSLAMPCCATIPRASVPVPCQSIPDIYICI